MKNIKLKALLIEKIDPNNAKEVANLLREKLSKTTAVYNRRQASIAASVLKINKVPKDVEEKAWDILYQEALQDKDWFIEVVLGM